MHRSTLRRAPWPIAAIGTLALVLAGCADAETDQAGDEAAGGIFPAELVEAAGEKATAIAGDADLGGSVTMIGTLGGAERERFLATLKPFEDATGVTVEFTGTEDYESVLQSSVDAGNPIDIAQSANLGVIERYGASGDLVDLNEVIGTDVLAENYAPGFLESTTVDGANYGIWSMVDNYELWYNPKSYEGPTGTDVTWDELTAYTDELSASGTAPWCMGLSAGANTGWPGAYFLLNLILKQSGPDVIRDLGTGDKSWDSPEVRAGFELFSHVVAGPETVYGGPEGAISTDPGAAGAGMYTDPAQCELMHWGTFTSAIILSGDPELEPITDLDFMPMPSITPEFADAQGYGGTIYSAFSDRPETAALMTYLASAEHANLIAATGNWTAANIGVDTGAYPNDILAKVADELLTSPQLVPFPIAVTAPDVTTALYTTVSEFVQDPSTLDGNLAELDSIASGS